MPNTQPIFPLIFPHTMYSICVCMYILVHVLGCMPIAIFLIVGIFFWGGGGGGGVGEVNISWFSWLSSKPRNIYT